jgi:hypothetical protein
MIKQATKKSEIHAKSLFDLLSLLQHYYFFGQYLWWIDQLFIGKSNDCEKGFLFRDRNCQIVLHRCLSRRQKSEIHAKSIFDLLSSLQRYYFFGQSGK